MDKRVWEQPVTLVQKFEANEYVAACGDSGVVYKFECNAPAGTLYYYPRSDGKIHGVYEGYGNAAVMGSYHPCSATHEAPNTGDFYDGFVDRNRNGKPDNGEGVIVWRERVWTIFGPSWDGHATTNLNMNSWETAKS